MSIKGRYIVLSFLTDTYGRDHCKRGGGALESKEHCQSIVARLISRPALTLKNNKQFFCNVYFEFASFQSKHVFLSASHKRSCSAIKAASKNAVSGKAFLDVDGIGPLPKVEVECHFNFGSTETVVRSKLSSGIDVENTFGKRRVNIQYYADQRSMISITTESQTCQQYVKYVCTKSALFLSPKGPPQVRISF